MTVKGVTTAKDFTTEELKAELARREVEAFEAALPKPLEVLNVTALKAMLVACIKDVARDGAPCKDFEHAVFVETLECFYGPDIWVWWNAHHKGGG